MFIRISGMINQFCNRILSNFNPKTILKRKNTLGTYGDEQSFGYLFDVRGLYFVLKENFAIWGAIVLLFLFITMLFLHDPKEINERKKDLEHKVFVVFLFFSAVWLFDILKKVFTTFMI